MRGRRTSLFAALASGNLYQVFLNSWAAQSTPLVEDLLNLAVFLLVALLMGSLAGRLREQAMTSRARAAAMERLLEASHALDETTEEDRVWQQVGRAVGDLNHASNVVAVTATGDRRACLGAAADEGEAMARAALTDRLNRVRGQSDWRTMVLRDGDSALGALAWRPDPGTDGQDDKAAETLSVLEQIASARLARLRANDARAELEGVAATARMREAMLSSLSHDFRSPLAAIVASSSSLLEYGEKFTPETRQDLLENIQEEAEHLDHYVSNLLNMSKLQAGDLETQLREVGVADAVTAALRRLRKYHHSPVEVRFSGGCRVVADPLLLEQAIYNVLDNAMKHGEGEKGITISAEVQGDTCCISISDCGPGLGAADLQTVFDRFRSRSARRGSGLGLSIVKGFIEAMGGSVAVRSQTEPASGLTITIKLPRAD
jgi:two-component system sensor histidine kinase KdpD